MRKSWSRSPNVMAASRSGLLTGGQMPAYAILSPGPCCARRYRASATAGERDRRQVGQQLGVLGPHRLHHHRVGGADEGAPRLLFPELKVFGGNEFVADDAPGDGPEAGLVAGVDQLLGRGRIEVRHRLRAEDEHAVALRRRWQEPARSRRLP